MSINIDILNDQELKDLVHSVSPEAEFSNDCRIYKQGSVASMVTSSVIYKIRAFSSDDRAAPFDNIMRQAFVSEYKALGLNFEIYMVNDRNCVYRIEKQQKIRGTQGVDLSSDEILKMTSIINTKVEKRLEFPHLASQILNKGGFDAVDKIGIARDCSFEVADYAIYENNALCLNDSAYFLALIDAQNRWWVDGEEQIIRVKMSYGTFYFANYIGLFDNNKLAVGNLLKTVSKWWLFPEDSSQILQDRSRLRDELSDMLSDNLEVIITGEFKDLKTYDGFDA